MNEKEERWALVTRATGYLGGHAIRALHRDGWNVVVSRCFSQKQIGGMGFAALGREGRYGKVWPGLVRFLATIVRPFNGNASALAMMFATLGRNDAVAPCYGEHQLEDHFERLAMDIDSTSE
ncbi:MAG: hypothetical protein GY811_04130 [Myxococcales bacterium]|nr:hypothetical protein [Myxococcales bacterium]